MPGNVPVSFRAISWRSAGLTMSYRSNTERVLWPVTVIATRSDTPGPDEVADGRPAEVMTEPARNARL